MIELTQLYDIAFIINNTGRPCRDHNATVSSVATTTPTTMSHQSTVDLCSSSDSSAADINSSVVYCCSITVYSDFVLPPYESLSYESSSLLSLSSSSVTSTQELQDSYFDDHMRNDSPFIPDVDDCCDSSLESLSDDSLFSKCVPRRLKSLQNR
jgi:hypothetical protein